MYRLVKKSFSKIRKLAEKNRNIVRFFLHKLTLIENSLLEKIKYEKELIPKVKDIQKKSVKSSLQSNCDCSKDEDLTLYLNKVFEQQEKDRIVRWLINGIRESLDLTEVMATIVDEIGFLLGVDRCLIALYEEQSNRFCLKSEYRKSENISSVLTNERFFDKFPRFWHKELVGNSQTILVNNQKTDSLNLEEKIYLEKNNIKSIIIIPIINKGNVLGLLTVHQLEKPREWENEHLEILYDTCGQIAVAISQAILYTRAQEATRLKSEFLASMSHELRTPLNSIIGFSDMLISEDYGSLNEKQKKFLNNVSISGKHLLRLVNDILDLSKIESNNMELHYEAFNVSYKVKETISILKSMAHKKKINIDYDLDESIAITADSRRFSQIMYNLISNAIKFTDEEGEINIKAYEINGKLKTEVNDNGIGISKTDKDKIFNKFIQLDSSYTRKQEGTGLGLALTKSLVELHKGEIGLNSEEGKGSSFWFILPGIQEAICTKNNK